MKQIKIILSVLFILISFNINAQQYKLETTDSCIIINQEVNCYIGEYKFIIDLDNDLFIIIDNNRKLMYDITNYYKDEISLYTFYFELQNIKNEDNLITIKLNLNEHELSAFINDTEIKYYSLILSK